MSIQLAAKHLAAHGRGPDTTLVHMTPGEVASLQALAQQHGGSLSINPQTGLPEAGFLSALLPMAAGAGLAAMGMPAGYAALSVGAASAATNGGDLRKSLMVGISAYGGASMAESFMGAGLGTMGGAMGAPAAAPATVLETSAGATSPYALTASTSAAPSTAGYSLGESSSYLNQPLPSLVSAAPAQVAQAAAAATPAAQAAQQAAALDSMSMGQRFDAFKAGATGTNALNYIKANPFTSLGVATAAMTPDETSTPQKAADTDRGPRAKLQYYSGYGTSLPAPNMQGIEQTYNRPYYAAEGGVTRMATGGITSAPRNQQQLFADYLARVSGATGAGAGVEVAPEPEPEMEVAPETPTAPVETPEEYAARMRLNARGGGGGMSSEQRAEQAADNDKPQPMLNGLSRNEYFKLSPEEQNAVRAQADADNPKTAAFLNFVKFAASPVEFLYDKLAPPPAPSEMQKYIDAADAESRILTRDRAYEAYGNSIEGVTAADAANAAYQRDQAEAANLARMQADTYPFGNFDDAPLSSRTDVSGYPLRESELKSFERGLAPTSAQVKKGDPFAGFFSSDPTLNQIAKYGDPFKQPAGFFPPGTAPTDKQFFRDKYGNIFAPGDSIPAGTTVSGNSYLADQDKLNKALTPYSAADEADRMFAAPAPAPVTSTPIEGGAVFGAIPLNTSKIVASEKLAGGKPIESYNFTPADARTPYGEGEGNTNKSEIAAFIQQQEVTAKDYMNSGVVFGFDHPDTVALKEQYDRFNNEINNLYNRIQYTDPTTNDYKTPFVNYKVTPDITPTVSDAISADPDADKTAESLKIPSAETFAAMLGSPFAQTAALNTGTVSDVGVLGGVPAPNMGYGQGRGAFGTIGGVWTNREGLPIRTADGSPVMTGAGAEAQAQQDARIAAFDAGRGGGDRNSVTPGGGSRDAAPATGDRGYGREGQHAMANGGLSAMANPYDLGSYSDGGRLLRGPGDGVSDSIPATIGKGRPARLADGEFVIPARIVSEIGNGSTEAGARKLYAMMDRIQAGRKKSVGKGKVAVNSRADKYLPA